MAKFDPLENVKIVDNGDGEKKKLLDKKKTKKAASPPAPPAPKAAPQATPTPKPAPKAEAKAPLDASKKYRVLKDSLISINGRITRVRAGKILEARRYGGPAGLERLLATGVEVEEC